MNAPLVVKLGGALLDDAASTATVVGALARVHAQAPGSLVVVHGGGVAIDRHLARLGMPTKRHNGIRITPPEQATEIASVLHGQVNTALVAALLAAGAAATGLRLTDGGLCTLAIDDTLGFDAGSVGRVTGGDASVVRALLRGGFLPVISSAGAAAGGAGPDTACLNVNADDAAAAVAGILGAGALVYLTDVNGVLDARGQAIPAIDDDTFERLCADGTITGGMIPKVRSALATSRTTGAPVVIASWKDPAALAQLASGGAAGTRIESAPCAAEL